MDFKLPYDRGIILSGTFIDLIEELKESVDFKGPYMIGAFSDGDDGYLHVDLEGKDSSVYYKLIMDNLEGICERTYLGL